MSHQSESTKGTTHQAAGSTSESAKARWGWEDYILVAGVAIGLVGFLVAGLVPALVYGGYAALGLLSELIGGPVEPTLLSRAFIVVGMALCVVAVGALFATGGAVLGLFAVGLAKLGLAITGAAAPAPKQVAAPESAR